MGQIEKIRSALPPYEGKKTLIKQRQGTDDIIREIIKTHEMYETDYDKIYPFHDTADIKSTCENIWNFLKYNLKYNEEPGKEQSVKSPAAILQPGESVDCKHYALYSGGILDGIKHAFAEPWDWCFRFATDKPGLKEPTHVFTVVFADGKEYWIDPCMLSFNYKNKWTYYIDEKPMSLVRISGPGQATEAQESKPVEVNPGAAWVSFLQMAQFNYFSVKELLRNSPEITATALKIYCDQKGFDYNQLLRFLIS